MDMRTLLVVAWIVAAIIAAIELWKIAWDRGYATGYRDGYDDATPKLNVRPPDRGADGSDRWAAIIADGLAGMLHYRNDHIGPVCEGCWAMSAFLKANGVTLARTSERRFQAHPMTETERDDAMVRRYVPDDEL